MAIEAVAQGPGAKFIAGGTNLIDLMKKDIERPDELVDITRLQLSHIEEHDGGLRLGALARNSDTANHPLVRSRYPLLSQAILAGASPQLRNAATNGGNLMQRTRCYYFYDVSMPCNKRESGSGCAAWDGYNRIHAILGGNEQCVAVHPSDMCVALTTLDAVVQVAGPNGKRSIPIREFHRLAGNTPQIDTNLNHSELITAIDLPAASAKFTAHSHYLKVRDRASYAFALVSAAVALELHGDTIRRARVSLGGVAHKPWPATEAEELLVGLPANQQTFRTAAEAALKSASPLKHNAFKVEMAKNVIVRALTVATEEPT
jgi:xanthine dehydrogenase YagS FAD-binding subunit